ncbi:hypothetical protein FQA39_LY14053 [Lamprigera yunnana]|nr:hypothetical protein FQA39_LY14053 [Lamprigera yunnana]
METRSTNQKPRETEEQEKFQILQEEELEEPTKSEERSNNCKEDKLIQMLLQMNSAMLNKLEETNQKLQEKMLNKFEENNKKLDETRTEIRTEIDQIMEKIQRQFLTIQERINENWDKRYVEVDTKWKKYKNKQLINVEAKINQHKEERIQVCEDLKEQKREIVNYIEEKIKIGNGTGYNVITNYSKIEREAPKFHPSKIQHPKVYLQELHTYLEVIKKQIVNKYDQTMEDAIIREAITIFHILAGQFEEEIHNKVMIDETKNFDDLVKILKAHDQCERDRKRLDGSKYYNRRHYNKYQYGKYNHGGQERDNYNYTRGPFHGNQFYHNNNNRNQRFQDNRIWNNYINGQYENAYRSREQTREGRNDGTFKRFENENENNRLGGRNVNINHIVQQPREEEGRNRKGRGSS